MQLKLSLVSVGMSKYCWKSSETLLFSWILAASFSPIVAQYELNAVAISLASDNSTPS